jgi:hypothetical protein
MNRYAATSWVMKNPACEAEEDWRINAQRPTGKRPTDGGGHISGFKEALRFYVGGATIRGDLNENRRDRTGDLCC